MSSSFFFYVDGGAKGAWLVRANKGSSPRDASGGLVGLRQSANNYYLCNG